MGNIKTTDADDRALSLQDTQGMFLLLGFGFLLGGTALISEWLGGCFKFCKTGKRNRSNSSTSIIKSMHIPSLNDKLNEDMNYDRSQSSNSDCSNVIIFHNPSCHNDENESRHNSLENFENTNTQHKNLKMQSNGSVSSDGTSDLNLEINNIFNFDHYFGDDNLSIADYKASSCAENYEKI